MRRTLLLTLLYLIPIGFPAQTTTGAVSADEPQAFQAQVAADTLTLFVGENVVGMIEESHPTVETKALQGYGTVVRGQTYQVRLTEPGTYHIDLRSYFFDAYLVLRDASGAVVAEDDDGLLGSHSRIVFEAKIEGEVYLVEACALHGGVGESEILLALGEPKALTGEMRQEAELADAREGLEVVKEAKGDRHPAYAANLNRLAELYYVLGAYEEAEPLFLEAREIRRAALGEEHPDYATSLNNLGVLYVSTGEYEKAEPFYLEALEIAGKALGEEHPDYARGLNNLGELYLNMGVIEKAEPLYLEALEVYGRTLGEQHPHYAMSLNGLAGIYQSMGAYEKAGPLYLEALEITGKALGEEHPDYAMSLNNLAEFYRDMGAYKKAEPLCLEAREVYRATLGEEHPYYALSLNNLGVLFQTMTRYEEAESLLVDAREITKTVLGEQHPFYATVLNNLASLYYAMGADEKAEPLYPQALAIYGEVLGQQHPGYATLLNNLAEIYTSMGAYEKAEPLYLEALNIRRDAQGEQHPDYPANLNNLAVLYRSMGALEKATQLHERAIALTEASLERAATVLTEERQVAMAGQHRGVVHDYLDTAVQMGGDARATFSAQLAWKGTILVRQRSYRRVAAQPEILPLFESLQVISRRLTSVYRSDPEPNRIEAWKENRTRLETERERLVRELTSKSAAFQATRQRITVEQVVEALPGEAVLVDYAVIDLERGRVDAHSKLVAFVVKADASVTLHDLGELEPIETAIDVWRAGGYGDSDEGKQAGSSLRAALWEPLLPRIGDAGLVLVSPDGALGQLPLSALPGREDDTYLLEDHRIALLPVPQLLPSLLMEGETETEPRTGLLAMGGVDYEAEPWLGDATPKKALHRHRNVDPGLRGGDFSSAIQANTLAEIALIEKLFAGNFQEPVVTLEDAGATEERFRATAPGSYYIHLATHGFFAPPHVETGGISPYLLSGLAFAGANRPPRPDADDGILTAEEIAFLPLESAELVCLSACETGLGKVAGGEGLLGLQRAFQISGARSTIASLWKVPDLATRLLMERFYLNLWEHDMSKLDALREAQLWLLDNPGEVRGIQGLSPASGAEPGDDGRTPPLFWAAFQISGDWR